jgi:hypothetical protein
MMAAKSGTGGGRGASSATTSVVQGAADGVAMSAAATVEGSSTGSGEDEVEVGRDILDRATQIILKLKELTFSTIKSSPVTFLPRHTAASPHLDRASALHQYAARLSLPVLSAICRTADDTTTPRTTQV